MAIGFFKFVKGILLNGETADPGDNLNGSMWHNTSDNKIKSYVQSAVREVVTNSQSQTLTNKTIDADSNSLSNIDNADIKAGAAIDASKLADGSVSNAEFQYLGSVTSDIQTQINNKADASSFTTHTGASSGVHGAVGSVVGTTDSQTLTNKTLTAPIIDVEVLSHQTTPANPSAGFIKVYAKSDDKVYKLNSAGTEVEVGGSSGANTTLSNLSSPVAINQDVLPDTTNTRSLGSTLKTFTDLILNKIKVYSSVSMYWNSYTSSPGIIVDNDASPDVEFIIGSDDSSTGTQKTKRTTIATGAQESNATVDTGRVTVITGDQAGGTSSGSTGDIQIYTGWHYGGSGSTGNAYLASGVISGATGASGGVEIESGDVSSGSSGSGTVIVQSGASAGAGPTGVVTIKSGNSTSGNSGDVTIQTGTAGGTRGEINLSASYVDFQGTNVKNIDSLTGSSGAGQFTITTIGTNADIVLSPNGTGAVNVNSSNITNVTDPVNPQDAATKIYVDTNSGGKNYISNKSADVDTSGWSTYADASQATPVDGTGGSANITWTRSTTTPLRGTADFNLTKDGADRRGQGVSYDFTIDSADKAKVINISFDYEVTAGTYADGDLAVYIYDVTNAQVIQPSGYTIQNSTVSMKQVASFQSASNSTSYRLIIHVASTSSNGYTLAFDNFIVGPQNIVNGTPITDWQSYTPSGSWSTNTTYSGKYRRNGDSLEGQIAINLSGAPTGNLTFTAAQLLNGLGLSIDTTKLEIQSGDLSASPGFGNILDTGVNSYSCSLNYSQTAALFYAVASANNADNIISATNPFTFGSTDKLSFTYRVPISGWSSNVQMSSDTDTRVTAFSGYVISHALTADTTLITLTADKDTHGGWSTNTYTVKVPGDYVIGATILSSSGAGSVYVVKNGSKHKYLSTCNTTAYGGGSVYMPSLLSGDTIAFKSDTNITITGTTVGGGVTSTFHITRVSGPSQIASTEKIEAVYKIASGVSSSTSQPIDFVTKVSDSHNAVTTGSSWKFTAPAQGTYSISATLATTTTVGINVYKNGSDANLTLFDANSSYTLNGTVQINLNAGDYIDLRSASAATLINNAKYSICIARIK